MTERDRHIEKLTRDLIERVHGSPQNDATRSAMWALIRALNARLQETPA